MNTQVFTQDDHAANTQVSARILDAINLTRHYTVRRILPRAATPFTALDKVSLSIGPGEIVGIVGESGSGKSTLARLLLGLDRPSAGSVSLLGQPIANLDRKRIASIVQPVFQDPYGSLNPAYTVAQLLDLPLRLHNTALDASTRQAAIVRLLEQVGLPARVLRSYPHALSGGQRQRVAIARALAVKPRLIICDEPTSALDVSVQAQILNLLLALRKDLNLALILISHNLAVVGHMSDRVLVMRNGQVVEAGATATVFANPTHAYTQQLFSSVLDVPRPSPPLLPVDPMQSQ
ncbi:ABC transporter ATP-binding protein [Pigmentiphaga aceris]|uniref:ABC transporter ATP-binding protein n=1 Tax=Pigmentiphaga aceris TaxID=1940612 RepID=UPI001651F669|nr:ATP-binding cassette domain-containing protein [Pigmentiphaga aceris]